MRHQQRVVVIVKQRPFDEEKWKQLLVAFAYVLHEQRKKRQEARPDNMPDGEAT